MFSLLLNSVFTVMANCFFLMSYVTNINSFKNPLSAEEERKYLKLYKNGDKEAKNILIERNLRLVAQVVKKFPCSSIQLSLSTKKPWRQSETSGNTEKHFTPSS